ncbi:MAG: LysM peptidoglycan-binding domain-containing protein [Gammaproteobacteria bacterium]|nr:LysM peptidoglycan-binding domain-containing protein [Gammaproteobacteria bacterium]MDE2345255.1 LysM peptidoglycan-binding domain-containing protein [Gammaproteobacteria bacterium]
MKDYNATRCFTALCLAGMLAACASAPKKPQPAPAAPPPPAPAPQAQVQPAPPPPPPVILPQAPKTYVVKKGDTLWGIASMYLKDPWRWPDIWYANPAIKNPHLIYPGDQFILGYINGRPTITVVRNGKVVNEAVAAPSLPVETLKPEIRITPIIQAIPTIPLNAIRPFLSGTRVVSKDELENAGYLLQAIDGRPIMGVGNDVYARGLKRADGDRYNLFRLGQKYVDPESGDTLGYQATYIGDGSVVRWGDPAKVLLTATTQEAMPGDRFLPVVAEKLNQDFLPHPPVKQVKGDIIAVLGGVAEIGQYQVVVLDRGTNEGLDSGTVLGIYGRKKKVSDPYAFDGLSGSVYLPGEREGILLVFRAYPKVSYGLVMEATQEIHLLDAVKNP